MSADKPNQPQSAPAAGKKRSPYLAVFVILAILTAMEVGASFLDASIRIPILILLAGSKVLLVLLYFMHLRFDHRIFTFPLLAAVILVIPIILAITLAMPILNLAAK
jgi:cytochrome c oxidase subunit IV